MLRQNRARLYDRVAGEAGGVAVPGSLAQTLGIPSSVDMISYNYLFGTPALHRVPSGTGSSDWFILGAYPSAIHVRWDSPEGTKISAVAVADEPEPFWDGGNQQDHINRWADALPWKSSWGYVSPPGKLNGSSGIWLRDRVIHPLGINARDAWITDCLDIYHESKGAAKRLDAPRMQALMAELGIQDRNLPSHPNEDQIVKNAQLDRLRIELDECHPKIVITLGNAPLRVFTSLVEGVVPIGRLAPDSSYGRSYPVRVPGGLSIQFLPLAHPAAPERYQMAHLNWLSSKKWDA